MGMKDLLTGKRKNKKGDKNSSNGHEIRSVIVNTSNNDAELQRLKAEIEQLKHDRSYSPLDPQSRSKLVDKLIDPPENAERSLARISRRNANLYPGFEIVGYGKMLQKDLPQRDGRPMTLREIFLDRSLRYSRSIGGKHLEEMSKLAGEEASKDGETPDHTAISH